MRTTTSPRSTLLVGLSLFTLGAHARWPIKTIDLSEDGALCDTATEQYLQVEGYDYHDHPKFTMRWRQLTGECGEALDESELLSWEVSYDGSTEDAEDDPPTAGNGGRVQLNLFVCCPFGDYEIDLDIESFSDEGSTLEQRTSWEIENGPDEYHIWDTVNTNLADDEAYSPTVNGQYTWPLEGETGYYKTLYAGPLPPLECSSNLPPRTELLGCYVDNSRNRLLGSDTLVLGEIGPDGMTAQICSDHCANYDYFGLEYGRECFCGTAEEFESAVPSDVCGTDYRYLCTGDATTACGGANAINVYQRTDATPAPTPSPLPQPTLAPTIEPTPLPTIPTVSPLPEPTPFPTPDATGNGPTFAPPTLPPSPTIGYSSVGCFADSKTSRIMDDQIVGDVMSAEFCFELCNNGINTHFGTQYSTECWCGVEADLTKNGEMLPSSECNFLCAGTTSGEFCGGRNKMTAYDVVEVLPVPEYIGCYGDAPVRAMNAEGKYMPGAMTNEVCISFCAENGHAYAGTQFARECWCGDSFDRYGAISESLCSSPCQGDAGQACGGSYALSVWSTAV